MHKINAMQRLEMLASGMSLVPRQHTLPSHWAVTACKMPIIDGQMESALLCGLASLSSLAYVCSCSSFIVCEEPDLACNRSNKEALARSRFFLYDGPGNQAHHQLTFSGKGERAGLSIPDEPCTRKV